MDGLRKANNQRKANDQTDIYAKELRILDAAGLRHKTTSIIYDEFCGNLDVSDNKETVFKPGDKVKTRYGVGEILYARTICRPDDYPKVKPYFEYFVRLTNYGRFWTFWFHENQLEIHTNDEGEDKTMENKELERVGQLALNIINKVRDYKIETAQDKCDKKIEEITKSAEVNKLVETHTEQLNKDINKLLSRDNDNDFIALLITSPMNKIKFEVSDNYLIEDEKSKKQKILDALKNEKKQINDKFNNIVDSLQLCTTVDQINGFLDNQGFRVNGLIVNPENWKG